MTTYNINTITSLPESNLYEDLNIKFEPIDTILSSNIINNNYINRYYKNINKCICVSNLFKKYLKCCDIHTITSDDEFEFYKQINNIPLTKKYYYSINSITNIEQINNYYKSSISINVKDLIYNNYLKFNLFSNNYCNDQEYFNSLSLNTIITIDVFFTNIDFINISEFTEYINSDVFHNDFIGHMNCILFNDIIIYDVITNGSTLDIVTKTGCDERFILRFNENYQYIEGDLETYSTTITNKRDTTTINSIDCDITHISLYKNIIYIREYDKINNTYTYNICMLDRFISTTQDNWNETYYNVLLGNNYFFETFNYQSSAKLGTYITSIASQQYTNNYFQNNYTTDMTESESFNVIKINYNYNNEVLNILNFPYRTLDEKFNILAVVANGNNLHYQQNYMKSINMFTDSDIITDTTTISNNWDGVIGDSKVIKIQESLNINPSVHAKTIIHTQDDNYEPVIHGDSNITNVQGSHFSDIKFRMGCKLQGGVEDSPVLGDLLYPVNDGYVSIWGKNNLNEDIVVPKQCLGKCNISQPIPTSLNKYSEEFTFIFMTNKYGYLNNDMKIGMLQENFYGKIIIGSDYTTSMNEIRYNIPVSEQDNTSIYDSMLHIITGEGNNVTYEVQSDSTLLCDMDTTIDMSKVNLSLLNVVASKKTNSFINDVDYIPIYRDQPFYHNLIDLGTPTINTRFTLDGIKFNDPDILYKHHLEDYNTLNSLYTTSYDSLMFEFTAPLTPYKITLSQDSDVYNKAFQYMTIFGQPFANSGIYLQAYDRCISQLGVGFSTALSSEQDSVTDGGANAYNSNFIQFSSQANTTISDLINSKLGMKMSIIIHTAPGIKFNSTEPFYIGIESLDTTSTITSVPIIETIENISVVDHNITWDTYEKNMSLGKMHMYNQKLPSQRLNKVRELYKNNRMNNTPLFHY